MEEGPAQMIVVAMIQETTKEMTLLEEITEISLFNIRQRRGSVWTILIWFALLAVEVMLRSVILTIKKLFNNIFKVLLVRLKPTKRLYAMKVIKKELVCDEEDIDWVQTEKHVFETASNHPFLVGLHSCFQTPSER